MTKHIVFVDEVLVSGSMRLAAANVGLNVAAEAVAQPPSRSSELALRRATLSNLASTLVGQPSPAGGVAATHALTVMRESAVNGAPAVENDGVQVLEGLSAFVVDDAAVDIASLNGVVGLTVVEDREVRLPAPIAVAAAPAPDEWHLNQIGLESGAAGGKDILVGILDTGIDAAHPEFAGKTIHFAEFDAIGRLVSTTARDAGDHGTHVSSTATGAQAGVAPNADLAVAAVLTIPTLTGEMSGQLLQIVNGFNWLITTQFRPGIPGVDVVSASLGAAGFSPFLRPGVVTAFRLGMPLIAAIGNNGHFGPGQHGSPANYPEVLSVGATDPIDMVADFSDWGVAAPPLGPAYPLPVLSAPGVQIRAAKPGGGFQFMSGTSMATPVVAGVAARRMATNKRLMGNPAALFLDLRTRLAPCRNGIFGNFGGAGRIIA